LFAVFCTAIAHTPEYGASVAPERVGPIPVIGSGDAVSGVCNESCAYHGT